MERDTKPYLESLTNARANYYVQSIYTIDLKITQACQAYSYVLTTYVLKCFKWGTQLYV